MQNFLGFVKLLIPESDAFSITSTRSPEIISTVDPVGRWPVTLDLDALHLDASQPFHVHDLLTDARYLWSGARNYIELDPARVPAHVFRVRRGVHNERDFDPQGA